MLRKNDVKLLIDSLNFHDDSFSREEERMIQTIYLFFNSQ